MLFQVAGFVVNAGITFLLTPFVIRALGVEAYGFIGLTNNIIGYLQIATVALNSMAGRFVAVEYHRGNFDKANKYFSSVFYSNCIFGALILLVSSIILFYLDLIIEVPQHLAFDVKLLFLLMAVNGVSTIIFNMYSVSTFIKNRLDIGAARQFVSNALRGLSLYLLFTMLSPHLWYMGCAALLCSIYLILANQILCRKLTPELNVQRNLFEWECVKELTRSGSWNLLTRLGSILQRGLDLLFANWWIGTVAMGILSVTSTIPFVILGVFSMLSSAFAPSMTEDFAKGNLDAINRELGKSIRILSICMLIPLSLLYVYGDVFYSLWTPSEDALLLWKLTVCGTFALLFTSPLESFWNIFTITNKIKGSSLFVLFNCICVFLTVVLLLQITDDTTTKMFIIASTRSIWGLLRGLLFLPIYGAYCLGQRWNTFYPALIRPIVGLVVTISIGFGIRFLYIPTSWTELALMSLVVCGIALICGGILILGKSEIKYITQKISHKR